MNLAYLIARQWRMRPGRTALSIAAVAIATAAVLGVALAQSAVRLGYQELLTTAEGKPALEIVSGEGGRFEAAPLPKLADVPGIASATPLVTRATMARAGGKRFRGVLLGIDVDDESAPTLPLVSGRACRKNDEVILSADLADGLKIKLGDRVTVLALRGPRSTKVVGLARAAVLSEYAPAATLVMPLAAVQQLYELGDRIDRVRVLVDSRDGREDARTAVAARLPASLVVQVPVEQRELAGTILRSTELALRFAGALSLAMAGFIVLNTLRMSFGERRRDMAILRVLGVTAPELVRLQLVEGVLLGLGGAVLGIPLGVVLGRGLGSVMQSLAGTEAPTAQTPYGLVLAALVVGPLVAALAALVPALQTRGISPAEALGDVEARRGERFPRWSIVAGLVVWSIAVVLLVLVGRETLPAEAAIPAGVLMLVGFIAVIPAILAPLVRSISRVFSAWSGAEGGFAAEQLLHRPTRTGLTIGVLVVALSTGVGLGNAITNNVNDVRAWYRRMTAGDIMLAGPSAAHGAVEGRDAEAISERIAATPGVDYVVESRYFPVRAAGVPTTCVVHDFDRRLELPWSVTSEEDRAIRSGLAAGDIVIGGNLAKRLEVVAGDELRMEVQGRVMSLRIAAVVRDYTLGGLAVFYDLTPARKQLELGTAEIFTVAVKSDAEVDGVVQQLKSRLGDSGLVVESFADVRQQLDRLIAGIVGALWALLAVGFVIGGVAVGNTLSMSVLEQTRELGLLRIIGMTRRQVRKLVLWESLLLGILGTLLGTLAGLTTAWIIHLCNEPLLGHALPFAFHGWLLAANAGACLVITLLAAWLPGERAARLDLLAAIAYE